MLVRRPTSLEDKEPGTSPLLTTVATLVVLGLALAGLALALATLFHAPVGEGETPAFERSEPGQALNAPVPPAWREVWSFNSEPVAGVQLIEQDHQTLVAAVTSSGTLYLLGAEGEQREKVTLPQASGEFMCPVFAASPAIVSQEEKGALRLYDLGGKEMARIAAMPGKLNAVAVADLGEGRGTALVIAFAGEAGLRAFKPDGAQIWQATGLSDVVSMAVAAVGEERVPTIFAVSGADHRIHLVDARSGKERKVFAEQGVHYAYVHADDMDGDGKVEVTAITRPTLPSPQSEQQESFKILNEEGLVKTSIYSLSVGMPAGAPRVRIVTGRFTGGPKKEAAVLARDNAIHCVNIEASPAPTLSRGSGRLALGASSNSLCVLPSPDGRRDRVVVATDDGCVCLEYGEETAAQP